MKIGIISDSHDNRENILKAIKIFKDSSVEEVLHLGDFVNPGCVKVFEGMKLKAVLGNNDGEVFRLVTAFKEMGAELGAECYECEIDGLKMILYHGNAPEITEALITCGKYDVVLYGHTHKKEVKKVRKTLVINPGTAHGFEGKATIALFDTKTKKVEFVEL